MCYKTWILLTVVAFANFSLILAASKQVNQFWVSHNGGPSANISASNSLKNNVYKLNGYFRRKTNHRQVDGNVTKLTRVGYGRAFDEAGEPCLE
jgi:hypothetical protein